MKLSQPGAALFIPDGVEESAALARTTHLAIGAHQDDLEIMAAHGIITCYREPSQWFTGVVVTNGSGSPRAGRYAQVPDVDLVQLRHREQCNAAALGEYGAQFLLAWPSALVKDPAEDAVVEELRAILEATRPRVLYTHNLADKHDTHVAVALRVIAAVRALPREARPETIYGCEVWCDLDWLPDDEKVLLDCSGHDSLLNALLGCFDSQLSGGKRYDLAAAGRRVANATFGNPRTPDSASAIVHAMDLTPLARDDSLSPVTFMERHLERFQQDALNRLNRHG